MAHVFIVTLGPVQEFIRAARKSRDLWYGSWVLSELSKAAAFTLHEANYTLVFPYPRDIVASDTPHQPSAEDIVRQIRSRLNYKHDFYDDRFNVANRIVAVCEDPDIKTEQELRDAIVTIGDKVEAQVRDRLEVLWGDARSHFVREGWETKTADKQIFDLPELYWAGAAYDPTAPVEHPTSYLQRYKQVGAVLAARKGTRDFKPVSWDGTGIPKSSLDGVRESVIHEKKYDDPKQLYKDFKARPAERLSGVDLLKRHGNRGEESRFASTSHVAAGAILKYWSSSTKVTKFAQQWNNYIKELAGLVGPESLRDETTPQQHPVLGWCDGGLLFESRLREVVETSQEIKGQKASTDTLRAAGQALQKFLESTSTRTTLSPYYAILVADGDSMGKAIDAQKTVAGQQYISAALSAFASKVRAIVETDHQGELIYAGGDDVLALLPLHTVLDCANRLADEFADKMQGFPYDSDKHTPTLSTGIAITHHIEPLSDALHLAREAEKRAKRVDGKNALCITVSKRSGAEQTVVGSRGGVYERLKMLSEWLARGELPDGIAFEYQQLWLHLAGEDAPAKPTGPWREIFELEAKRIFDRKTTDRGKKVSSNIQDKVLGFLKADAQGWVPSDLVNGMIVARLFADAILLAERGGHPYDVVAN